MTGLNLLSCPILHPRARGGTYAGQRILGKTNHRGTLPQGAPVNKIKSLQRGLRKPNHRGTLWPAYMPPLALVCKIVIGYGWSFRKGKTVGGRCDQDVHSEIAAGASFFRSNLFGANATSSGRKGA